MSCQLSINTGYAKFYPHVTPLILSGGISTKTLNDFTSESTNLQLILHNSRK